jgi:hypothetical protein
VGLRAGSIKDHLGFKGIGLNIPPVNVPIDPWTSPNRCLLDFLDLDLLDFLDLDLLDLLDLDLLDLLLILFGIYNIK